MKIIFENMHAKIKQYSIYALYILVLAFIIKQALGSGDFKVFLEAAKLVASGKTPYNQWIFVSEGVTCLYFYSPLWACILIPFSYLPNFIPNFIWLLANTYFLYRIWLLLSYYLNLQKLTTSELRWLLFLSTVMSLRFVLYNFGLIQMTIFLLWGSLESIHLFRKNRFILGGILLALIINIKILPLVLIPYLIYRKEFKGAGSTLFFSVLFLFLPALFLGWSTNFNLHKEWWSVINPSNGEHLIESGLGVHSLTALIPSLLTETTGDLPYTRNIFNLDLQTTYYILNSVRIGFVLLTLYVLQWPPFKSSKTKTNELHELSYIFLLIPLIFPHQQKYDFFFIYPALFYILYFVVLNFKPQNRKMSNVNYFTLITLLALSFILMTVSTDGIIGRPLNLITQHYKTVTYGALILVLAVLIYTPSKLGENDKHLL